MPATGSTGTVRLLPDERRTIAMIDPDARPVQPPAPLAAPGDPEIPPIVAAVAMMAMSCFLTQLGLNIAFFIALVLLGVRAFREGPSSLRRLPGLDAPMALWAVAFLVSAVAGVNPGVSLGYWTELKRLLIAYIAASALTRRRHVTFTLTAALLGACASAAMAFHQWLFGATVVIHRVTLTFRPGEWTSPIGFSSTCNDLAVLLVLALGLVTGPFLFYRIPVRPRLAAGAATLVVWLGILRTLSRSGLVAGVGSMIALGAALSPRRLLVPLLAMLLIYPLLPATLTYRHWQIFDMSVYPNQVRLRLVHVSLQMVRDHGLLGIGRRNFTEVHRRMLQPGEEVSPHAHNNYLNVLAEQGVPGLIALVWFQLALFRYLIRYVRAAGTHSVEAAIMGGILMSQAGFALAGLFLYDWGDTMPASFMWLLVGTAYAVGERIAPIPGVTGAGKR